MHALALNSISVGAIPEACMANCWYKFMPKSDLCMHWLVTITQGWKALWLAFVFVWLPRCSYSVSLSEAK